MEEIFQSIRKWCLEDYDMETVDYCKEYQQTEVEEWLEQADGIIQKSNYKVVIYIDGSIQMLE